MVEIKEGAWLDKRSMNRLSEWVVVIVGGE